MPKTPTFIFHTIFEIVTVYYIYFCLLFISTFRSGRKGKKGCLVSCSLVPVRFYLTNSRLPVRCSRDNICNVLLHCECMTWKRWQTFFVVVFLSSSWQNMFNMNENEAHIVSMSQSCWHCESLSSCPVCRQRLPGARGEIWASHALFNITCRQHSHKRKLETYDNKSLVWNVSLSVAWK